MDKIGEVITEHNHPDIYKWLSVNVKNYNYNESYYTLTSENKINAYCDVTLYKKDITQIKYPFGNVRFDFDCSNCYNLTSFIGAPEKVGWCFRIRFLNALLSFKGFPKYVKSIIYFHGNRFSNNPSDKDQYKFYLAMWLELFESITNEERLEYITNCKDKISGGVPIIPIEIMKEYGF